MKNIVTALPETIIVGFATCLLAFISFNCVEMPLQPIAPSSDIQLSMPVADVTHYVLEWVKKSPALTLNPGGTFSYLYNQSMPPQAISQITLQPQGSAQQVAVGEFTVGGFPIQTKNVGVSQMQLPGVNLPFNYPGALPPLLPAFPPAYISRPGETISLSSQFDFVRITNGNLSLQLSNNLPLRIDFNRPVILRNNQFQPFVDTSMIATFNVGVVDSFKTYSGTVSLAGKILRAQLKFDSISFSTEQRSSSFSLTASNGVDVQISSSSLKADSASAVIPSQTVASINDTSITLDDTIAIQNAQFRQGSFDFALINRSNVQVGVFLKVNDIRNIANGDTLRIDATLQGQDSVIVPIIFNPTNYQVQTTFNSSSKGTNLVYSVGIKTINSGVDKKVITKNDFIRAEIRPKQTFILKSVTGRIKPQTILVNQGINTNFPGLQEIKDKLKATLNFRGVSIKLRLPITGGGFPMDYNLNLISKNSSTGTVDTLGIPANSVGQFRITPGGATSEIDLSSAPGFNTFLSHFFSFPNLPDLMSLQGTVVLSPTDVSTSGQAYTVDDTSKVYPNVALTFPSELGIQNGSYKDVLAMSEENNNQDFTNKMLNARINITATNGIPLGVKFSIKFLTWNKFTHHSDTTLTIVPDSTFLPAYVTSSGIVTGPRTSYVSIILDTAEVRKFNSSDSVAINLTLATSNSSTVPPVAVVITTNQAIRLRASATMTYRIQGKQ
ncbi:MAG: hypothetical protein ABR936_11270 [Bacteroidota bacterium]|jgi:hypothetical protein